jgi:hypothetical protein
MPALFQVRVSPSLTMSWAGTTPPSLHMGRLVLARHTPCRDPCQQRCRTTTHRYAFTNLQLASACFCRTEHIAAAQAAHAYVAEAMESQSSSRVGYLSPICVADQPPVCVLLLQRGLAPRVFQYLFTEIDKAQDEYVSQHVYASREQWAL